MAGAAKDKDVDKPYPSLGYPARLATGFNQFGVFMSSASALQALGFLIVATVVEVSGDAILRMALYNHPGITAARIALFLLGAALLFTYGTFLNLAPLEFREVVGLYIATLFVVWQIINFAFFRTLPTAPILIGGSLIVAGGAIVSFWKQ